MDYISAREAAQQWKISQRRVSVLCSEGDRADGWEHADLYCKSRR